MTLVFTDIEGSTRLLEELGEDGYAALLTEHHRVCRNAWSEHGGKEVGTEGDAFFVVFAATSAALLAAAAAQEALVGLGLRVRMGVHVGEVSLRETGYVGMAVHRAARIAAAAHGEQVVVSAAAAAVSAGQLSGLELRDLGEHRLKDLSEPQRLFQLGGRGLRERFPPLKSLGGYFTNLPTHPTPLLGRAAELAELGTLLETHRLVTLTGPGGTGKTRLALQAGAEALDRFPGGVFFSDLALLRDSELVPAAIVQAIGLREQPGETSEQTVSRYIGERPMLLLLDNFEQLLEAAPLLARLLAVCPNLRIVATSRAPLRLQGEREFLVEPLELRDAVALFEERAALLGQRMMEETRARATVEAICERLDRLPLAIELAAARLRSLGLEDLLARLQQRLSLLSGGRRDAPDRQQTLRATLDWSYGLLDAGEQRALAGVAVFAGGFSADAAEVVCDVTLDEIAALVEQSLVRRREERLDLLETIREYGLERLTDRGEERNLRTRHADWFVTFSERASGELWGSNQLAWLDRLELELDNLRAALAFLLGAGRIDSALRLASSLWIFWEARHPKEGLRALEASLENRVGADPRMSARAMHAAGQLLFFEGDMRRSRTHFEVAVRIFRELGDEPWLAISLTRLSWVAIETNRADEQVRLALEALAVLERVSEPWARAETLNYAGTALAVGGEWSRGRALLEQSRATYLAMGNDQPAEVLNNLGWVAMLEGDFTAARSYHSRNVEAARRVRDGSRLSHALGNLGLIEALAGDLEGARSFVLENLSLQRDRGERRNVAEALVVAAAILAGCSDHGGAGRLVGASEAMHEFGGGGWNDLEREVVETHVLAAVAERCAAEFAQARAEGHGLTIPEAIDFALEALERTRIGGS